MFLLTSLRVNLSTCLLQANLGFQNYCSTDCHIKAVACTVVLFAYTCKNGNWPIFFIPKVRPHLHFEQNWLMMAIRNCTQVAFYQTFRCASDTVVFPVLCWHSLGVSIEEDEG